MQEVEYRRVARLGGGVEDSVGGFSYSHQQCQDPILHRRVNPDTGLNRPGTRPVDVCLLDNRDERVFALLAGFQKRWEIAVSVR